MNMISRPAAQPQPQPSGFADSQAWMGFLRPLLLVVPNAPSREDFARKCDAFAFFLKVPAEMLTTWRQQELGTRFKYFPTPAEVQEWLAPDLAARRDTAERRQMLEAPKPELRPERTAEEKAAARASVEAFMAERNKATGRENVEVKAIPLSDSQLMLQYERYLADAMKFGHTGPLVEMARLRLNALRAKHFREAAE